VSLRDGLRTELDWAAQRLARAREPSEGRPAVSKAPSFAAS
jgi:hypothetical protein